MLMTGTVKVVEKIDGKDVVTDEKPGAKQGACTDDQRTKVKEAIATYVKSGPAVTLTNAVGNIPTSTGSVTPAPASKE
jgi:hypothetical protein